MSMTEEPGFPELPQRLPTRELLLAQALEACITAERRKPGSAQAIIAQQPAWARADLQWMMGLAGSLDAAAADARMSPEFRLAARTRLMKHIGAEAAHEPLPLVGPRLSAVPSRNGHHPRLQRRSPWLWRGSASLVAAVLGVAATLTASASALPGEPLYQLKQAQEALNVRLAADDQARALALLGQADARLDETARLLQQGRTDAANETTQRYGQFVERATTTYVVTIDDTPEQAPGTLNLETRLTQQQEQLQTILQTAPEPARADLREALVTTERGRALVADPRPVEQALGKPTSDRSAVAAAVPTMAAEDLPTVVPTRRPAIVPAPNVVVAQATEQPVDKAVVAQQEATGRGEDILPRAPTSGVHAQNTAPNNGGRAQDSVPNRGGPAQQPARAVVPQDQHPDEVANSPAVVARDDGGSDQGSNGPVRGGTTPSGRTIPLLGQADGRAAPQPNNPTAPNGNGSGSGNEADTARGHNDEPAQAQPVVAHQPVAPLTATDSRSGAASDNKPAGGGTAGGGGAAQRTTTPPQVASPGEKPTGGTVGRDNGDPRSGAPASTAPGAKVQPTPVATPGRRAGGDNNGTDTAHPTPTHNGPVDPHGGGGNGGGDGGHGGD
jgi:uncharacterized protein DUF5667